MQGAKSNARQKRCDVCSSGRLGRACVDLFDLCAAFGLVLSSRAEEMHLSKKKDTSQGVFFETRRKGRPRRANFKKNTHRMVFSLNVGAHAAAFAAISAPAAEKKSQKNNVVTFILSY
jgi:hypothetical protein